MRPVHRLLLFLAAMVACVWIWSPTHGSVDLGVDGLQLGEALEGSGEQDPVLDLSALPEGTAIVVDLDDGATDADLVAVEAALGSDLDWFDPTLRDEAIAVGQVADRARALALLAGRPGIERAEPVIEMRATKAPSVPPAVPVRGFPDDPEFSRQWHLDAMGAQAGWWQTPRGRGVVVAVIDTGVTASAELPAGRVLEGRSFVPGEVTSADLNGHGTHVAGTIAQATHNGTGVAGVAPEATILPVKVLSQHGSGSSVGVAAGIRWAVDEGADVINLSLGSGLYSAVIHSAVRHARAQGVLVVAAAGNDRGRSPGYPGRLREVIGVSATGPDGTLAPYSNRGRGVDLAAPGGDKRVAGGGVWQHTVALGGGSPGLLEFQGTSMATPHVAGAAADLLSLGFLSPREAERVLLAGADGTRWTPDKGYGDLDLQGSLAVLGVADAWPRFGLGAAFAFLIAGLAGGGAVFRLSSTVLGAVAAAGLPWFAQVPGVAGALAGRGVLHWPLVLAGPTAGAWAPWLALVVPVAGAAFLAPWRWSRPLALGLGAGVCAHLVHGLAAGAFASAWIPTSLTVSWFGLQAVVSLLAALAVAGVVRLEREHVEER